MTQKAVFPRSKIYLGFPTEKKFSVNPVEPYMVSLNKICLCLLYFNLESKTALKISFAELKIIKKNDLNFSQNLRRNY